MLVKKKRNRNKENKNKKYKQIIKKKTPPCLPRALSTHIVESMRCTAQSRTSSSFVSCCVIRVMMSWCVYSSTCKATPNLPTKITPAKNR